MSISEKVAQILQEDGTLPAFAWPGGYPIVYYDDSYLTLCPDCANLHDEYSGIVVDYGANYADVFCVCDNCNELIDPAYITGEELIIARYGDQYPAVIEYLGRYEQQVTAICDEDDPDEGMREFFEQMTVDEAENYPTDDITWSVVVDHFLARIPDDLAQMHSAMH